MPKKTVKRIIAGNNDYLIGLKENQPTLYKTAQNQLQQDIPLSVAIARARGTIAHENTHSREVKRKCLVFKAKEKVQKNWAGLSTFVVVEREGIRNGEPWNERQFYISSQTLDAKQLGTSNK